MTIQVTEVLNVQGLGAPSVAPSGQGRIYFDSGSNKFRFSESGGAYADFGTGSGSSGANTALSNLSSVNINTSLTPATDDGYRLGSPNKRWKDGYFSGAVYFDDEHSFIGMDVDPLFPAFPSLTIKTDSSVDDITIASQFVNIQSAALSIYGSADLLTPANVIVTNANVLFAQDDGLGAGQSLVFSNTASNITYGYVDGGRFYSADGSFTRPTYSYKGDFDTGMYRIGANDLGFSNNGILRFNTNTSALNVGQDIVPFLTDGYKLGSSTKYWKDGYISALHINATNDMVINRTLDSFNLPGLNINSGSSDAIYLTANFILFGRSDAINQSYGVFSPPGSGGMQINGTGGTQVAFQTQFGGATNSFITIDGYYNAVAGDPPNPPYTFNGDSNTGMYRIAADTLGFATGGTSRLNISTSAINTTLNILPTITNRFDLGSSTLSWRDGYFSSLDLKKSANATTTALTIENLDTTSSLLAASAIDYKLSTTSGDGYVAARIAAGKEQTWTPTTTTVDGYLGFFTVQDGALNESGRFASTGQLVLNRASGNAISVPSGASLSFTGSAGTLTLTAESGARINSSGIFRSDQGYWIGGVNAQWTTTGLTFAAGGATAWLRQDQSTPTDARLIGNGKAVGSVATRVGTSATDGQGAKNSILFQACVDNTVTTPIARFAIDGYGNSFQDGYGHYNVVVSPNTIPPVGIYSSAANTLNLTTASTSRLSLTNASATFANDVLINGNTTIGDASGDSVTVNAAAWTFANDTNFTLSGGINGLSFDGTTFSVDAANDRIGLGTAAPVARFDITAGTLATTVHAVNIIATLPNSGVSEWASQEFITSNSSASGAQFGFLRYLLAGFTGAASTTAEQLSNAAQGTLSDPFDHTALFAGNYGMEMLASGSGSGANIGAAGTASASTTLNIGLLGKTIGDGNTSPNVGVVGEAGGNATTSPVGGYFFLSTTYKPTMTAAALVADNGDQAQPIFLARDNGTTILKIVDGGQLQSQDGSAGTPQYSFSSDTNVGMYRITTDVLGFSTAGVERLRLSADGYAGVNNTTPVSFLDVLGSVGFVVTTISATTTLTYNHHTVLCDGYTAGFTVNLPAVASSTRRRYEIKKIDSSSNTITIDGSGSETIDGATTQTMSTQYQSFTIVCNGTAWYIV